jgi:hypothetical protein
MSLEHDAMPERSEIEQETSTKVLVDWHDNAIDLLDSLKAQIAAHILFGVYDDDDEAWAFRAKTKAGYVGTALRRIERRMVQVGLELPLTVGRKERERMHYLEGVVGFLQRLCDRNEIEHGTPPIVRTKREDT